MEDNGFCDLEIVGEEEGIRFYRKHGSSNVGVRVWIRGSGWGEQRASWDVPVADLVELLELLPRIELLEELVAALEANGRYYATHQLRDILNRLLHYPPLVTPSGSQLS